MHEGGTGVKGHGQFMQKRWFVWTAILLVGAMAASPAEAHGPAIPESVLARLPKGPTKPILSDTRLLRELGIPIVAEDQVTGVAIANIGPADEIRISQKAHEWGRCGGYEKLRMNPAASLTSSVGAIFGPLRQQHVRNQQYQASGFRLRRAHFQNDPRIQQAISQVSEQNLRDIVTWLSSFPTRYNKGPKPNDHVVALKQRLEQLVSGAAFPIRIDLIDHQTTPQKTIRLRMEGKSRPQEIVVLGGHLDSISFSWLAPASQAPGADDNASGSANLIEAVRILARQPQPERSIEFFWYAGEESGLLGSAEIAAAYRAANRDVIGALQLDMTLFPGDGEFVLGSMADFTSAWLRDYLRGLNDLYIRARIIDDRCGYACSDHASWHRNGYPALMPFEASKRNMNRDIHTNRDVINNRLSFKHSAMFSRIAIAFAMDLGNSKIRSP